MKKIGMIGVGNMGGAILRGMIASGYVAAEDVMACLHSEEKCQALAAEIPGLTCTTDAKALAQECRMIVLAVKPQVLGELLDSIKGEINDRALVSIAAGWTMDMLTSKVAGTTATLLRVMPNTPALVGAGMTAICRQTPRLIWHMRRVFLMQLAKRRSLTRNCLTASLRSAAAVRRIFSC